VPPTNPTHDQTAPSITAGTLLAGKYRIERVLGEGGMGVVLAATNEALRQRVAIKLLRTGALANPNTLGRFEREARAAASLRSEHVARVVDVGKLEDGRPYMVMEYLDGQDLGCVIEHADHLPVGVAVDYVLQACEAIAEAHAAGIIHRDLKPTNLFLALTVDGRPLVKVLDFGISKMDDAAEDMSLTRTTEIVGSPSYMSPEQLRASRGVDIRTDIWAIGVILYELLTKDLPFQASTITELVAVVLTEPVPDVRVLRPDVPAPLAEAITRCLAKPRDARFENVAELVRAIAPFASIDDSSMSDRVERVARVAAGSGRLPPITGSGSGPHVAQARISSSGASSSTAAVSAATVAFGDPSASNPAPQLVASVASVASVPPVQSDAPPAGSSARVAVHGGTSVAWGETQSDDGAKGAPGTKSSRWAVLVGAAAAVLVIGGVGAGALVYMKRSPAVTSPTVGEPPPSASMPLPDGRKDLPPLASAAPSAIAEIAPPPSALPTSRVPTSTNGKKPILAKPGASVTVTAAVGAPPSPPPSAQHSGDDLSNIGRR
jgi:serine/threonine-protein kinase